jgi:hypothetical protein
VTTRSRRNFEDLLKLYQPNVGKGNFQPDVFWRGANEMLAKVIVTLGLATEDEVTARFRKLDEEAWQRGEEAIARANARERERRLAREAG